MQTLDELTAAVRANYDIRPSTAEKCQLGDLMIVMPRGAEPRPGLLWIMGFNGGESGGPKDEAGDNPGARRWFRLCEEAAQAVESPAWIIGERTHWGSPNIGELETRVGSPARFRQLLRFHAEINRGLLALYRPKIVWMTGLSAYVREAEDDYRLKPQGVPASRDKRGKLWQEYRSADGVHWLATVHPTGARMSRNELEQVKAKLASMAG